MTSTSPFLCPKCKKTKLLPANYHRAECPACLSFVSHPGDVVANPVSSPSTAAMFSRSNVAIAIAALTVIAVIVAVGTPYARRTIPLNDVDVMKNRVRLWLSENNSSKDIEEVKWWGPLDYGRFCRDRAVRLPGERLEQSRSEIQGWDAILDRATKADRKDWIDFAITNLAYWKSELAKDEADLAVAEGRHPSAKLMRLRYRTKGPLGPMLLDRCFIFRDGASDPEVSLILNDKASDADNYDDPLMMFTDGEPPQGQDPYFDWGDALVRSANSYKEAVTD